MNIAEHLERTARQLPAHPAIIFEGRTISYRELEQDVDRAAHGLVDLGVRAGDRVCLFLPNIPEFAIAYLAIQKIGAVAVSANAMLTTSELSYILEDAGGHVLFTTGALSRAWRPLADGLQVILCEGELEGFTTLGRFIAGWCGPFRARNMDRDDPAAILYTSGTTGQQKGATLSHGNLCSNTLAASELSRMSPADRALLFLPLSHVFGQNAIMNTALAAAATIVLQRRFDPEETVATIEREQVTMVYAVPTIYIALLNSGVETRRLASVRYYFSAAATLPVEVGNRWQHAYGRAIAEGYGLTETSPYATYNDVLQHRPGSVGAPIKNVDAAVLDSDDNEVPVGVWGEICIKGPNVMLGYWHRPAESAQALRGGWFHTGDIGYVDHDGYIFLVDRVKDMINSAGFKIWPREVEEVLFTHPAIRECAVVGLPDELKGEIPVAFVVLRDGATTFALDLEQFCRLRLAAYKVPRRIEFVDSLPKNATGKILKRELRNFTPAPASP
jgi:long-chain acyl-CoA synthetase